MKGGDITGAVQGLLRRMLATGAVEAVMAPQILPPRNRVMATLTKAPEELDGVDPLAPAFPLNAAKIVSRLTRRPSGAMIAAVLRPCEIRAFVELVKLKQGDREGLIIVSLDCLGAFPNRRFAGFVERHGKEAGSVFSRHILSGHDGPLDGCELARACLACEHPVAAAADIQIGIHGAAAEGFLLVSAQTEAGESVLEAFGLENVGAPDARRKTLEAVLRKRTAYRDEMFATTRSQTDTLPKLAAYFADCINCYNCRVACPVCYCKECVFVTDVFDHQPAQYLKWADRKGVIKLPTDTLFYHLTRMAHMSTACVGCGQCSNACPNDIPVMDLFRTVAHGTQRAFDYEAGRRIDETPPLTVFREDEFEDVVGID